ncbi:Uncharacterized protein OBRU01_17351 [Operophtera brumata]|uniref:Uncharacterized protein n=1 Tax=Operophtera brumata TaxID=104452 RepID=A0A0L7L1C4_OPEBR|nr:Uncharacterized protein OBRU01_17351 [Operophtera brumata]
MAVSPRKYLIKDLVNKTPPLDVWVQGTIEQTVGTDILILADTSGRLPGIQATKFIDLTSQPEMKFTWENDVKETNLFMEGKVAPKI